MPTGLHEQKEVPQCLGVPPTTFNLQPPTQALHYKSQDYLAQELDSAPGWAQRCPWVGIGDGETPVTWVSVSGGDGFPAWDCTGAPPQSVWDTIAKAKPTVWPQGWVGINFAWVTGCTTSLGHSSPAQTPCCWERKLVKEQSRRVCQSLLLTNMIPF